MNTNFLFLILFFLNSINSKVKITNFGKGSIPANELQLDNYDTDTELSMESQKLQEELLEEDIRNNKNLQPNILTEEEIQKMIQYDDLIIKIPELILDKVMKSTNYALIWIDEYDETCTKQTLCKRRIRLYNAFKAAAMEIVSLKPTVLMIYIKCSDSPSLCNTAERQKNVPFVVWWHNGKVFYYDFNVNGEEKKHYVNFVKNELKYTNVAEINNKLEFTEFVQNDKYIRLLGVFPPNHPESDMQEKFFNETIINSFIQKSGEFLFAKIYDTSLVNYNELDKDNPSILTFNLIPPQENLDEIPNILHYDGKDFFNRVNVEQIRSYHMSSELINENNNKTLVQDNFLKELLLETFPYIFTTNSKIYQLSVDNIDYQFLLILDPESRSNIAILENYTDISKRFRESKILISFVYIFFDSLVKDSIGDKVSLDKFPILFFNDNRAEGEQDIQNLLYKENKLSYKGLEEFFFKSVRNSEMSNSNLNRNSKAVHPSEEKEDNLNKNELQKVVFDNFRDLVINSHDDVAVFYHNDDFSTNVLCKKWNLLLKTVQNKINTSNSRNKPKIYLFNVGKNAKAGLYFPKKIPQLVLFRSTKKNAPVDYPQGPSIKQLANFLELFLNDLELNIAKEDIDKYLSEIFNNPEYNDKGKKAVDPEEKIISKDFDEELYAFEHGGLDLNDDLAQPGQTGKDGQDELNKLDEDDENSNESDVVSSEVASEVTKTEL